MKLQLDWSEYEDQGMGDAYADIPKSGGDFAKAVSVCIRSGRCELDERGLMCPSFKISDDPDFSPGGRVRLLKAFLNNQLQPKDEVKLAKVMDACVACKGCKRECENNLDMAQIKAEFLAQKLAHQPLSYRDHLIANWPYLLYRFAGLRALCWLHNKLKPLAYLAERCFGISAEVQLPLPAAKPFRPDKKLFPAKRWVRPDDSRSVVLWVDAVTALYHPEQAEDAIEVLNRAGYSVWVIHPKSGDQDAILDSGRSLFSKGLVARTQEQAQELLKALEVHARFNRPILGLEPSSLLMLRDEFLALNLPIELQELALKVAKHAFLFEEFIGREIQQKRFLLEFKPEVAPTKVLVHGHCHQKAVGAMKSMRKVLKSIPGVEFEFVESSCCGMAGSYGLESEHVKDAQDMALLKLIPALKEQPSAQILCNGFGCSHQIRMLDGRSPKHLVSLIRQRLSFV